MLGVRCAVVIIMSAAQGSTTISMKGEQLSIDLEDLYDILNLEEQNFGTPHEQKTEASCFSQYLVVLCPILIMYYRSSMMKYF